MRKKILRILPEGILLFLIPACAVTATAPTATTGGGLPAATPTIAEAATAIPAATDTAGVPAAETGETVAPRLYAVVLVAEGGTLEAHTTAGTGSPSAGSLPWDAAGISSTGRIETLDSETWIELNLPGGGTGWVDRKFLTEYVPSVEFCTDGRAVSLFEALYEAARTSDGSILASIISPVHGLTVIYLNGGNPKIYDPEQAGAVFDSPEVVDWGLGPGSGLPVQGTFADLVRPDLLAVFGSAETYCNEIHFDGASYTVEWPSIWKNLNYYSVHKPGSPDIELDWMTWLAGVEYVEGNPFLFSLSRYAWEP